MFLVTPIILSHTPPICEACGGLKIHIAPFSLMNFLTAASSTFIVLIPSSLALPTKLVPLSERKNLTSPLRAINLLRALINAEELSESTTSMWTALVVMQVNSIAQRVLLA
ncbi:hypothetical protein DPMN_167515 [Dreissena polymorpha]|uniref:Uncharacterized protein n=1 Tax=Dreissena polymorpha TaxID=45954 RepID=A0A9D4EYZ8_DREPO|nr:hypothetical protein DPMN_167515 [Dreissena polymorpha]